MQRKILGTVSVDLDVIGQLLIIYFAFVKYLRQKENRWGSLWFISEGSLVQYSYWVGIRMKLVRLIQICLNETYSTVWIGKHLSDMFTIKNALKQGEALLQLLFNFAWEYAIKRVHVNQETLKLHGTHQLLVHMLIMLIYQAEAYLLRRKTEEVVATKETGLEVNDEKPKYMVPFRDRNYNKHW